MDSGYNVRTIVDREYGSYRFEDCGAGYRPGRTQKKERKIGEAPKRNLNERKWKRPTKK